MDDSEALISLITIITMSNGTRIKTPFNRLVGKGSKLHNSLKKYILSFVEF